MFRGPPSTPGRDHYYDYDRQPSTTPAGPPPPDESHYPSSTPAGPPPGMNNGLFGNTRPTFNPNSHSYSTNSLFDSSPPKQGLFEGIGAGSIGTSTSGRPPVQRGRITSSHFQAPTNALNRDAHGESDHDEGTDEDEPLSPQRHNKTQNRFSQSVVSRTSATDMEPGLVLVRSGAKQTKFDLLALARGLTSDAPQGRWMPTGKQKVLNEGDHLILETERLAEKVHESLHSDSPDKRTEVLGTVAHEWFMGIAALTNDYANANEKALQYWTGAFGQGVLSIALTDTFGTPAFLKAFTRPAPNSHTTDSIDIENRVPIT